jgi:hypothetical protein
MAIYFDALKYMEDLQAAGLSEQQAKGQARALQDALNQTDSATKQDIAELKAEIARLETRLTNRMIAINASFAVLIIAVLQFLK